jgi:hypothetical protein
MPLRITGADGFELTELTGDLPPFVTPGLSGVTLCVTSSAD